MKGLKIIVLVLLVGVIMTFAYQNLEYVNISFIKWSVSLPLSLTVLLSFIIGLSVGIILFYYMKISKKNDSKEDKKDCEEQKENIEYVEKND